MRTNHHPTTILTAKEWDVVAEALAYYETVLEDMESADRIPTLNRAFGKLLREQREKKR